MGVRVKEVGKSEGRIVTIWIEVQTLPHTKVGRLPTGVSSRELWTNNVYVGKQMTAEISLAGAPTSGNASLPPFIIVISIQKCIGGSLCQGVPLRCLSLLR